MRVTFYFLAVIYGIIFVSLDGFSTARVNLQEFYLSSFSDQVFKVGKKIGKGLWADVYQVYSVGYLPSSEHYVLKVGANLKDDLELHQFLLNHRISSIKAFPARSFDGKIKAIFKSKVIGPTLKNIAEKEALWIRYIEFKDKEVCMQIS
jgi:hypothetical protein